MCSWYCMIHFIGVKRPNISLTLQVTGGLDPETDSVWRDVQSFACLACEMFLKDLVQCQDGSWSLEARFTYLSQVHRENPSVLPR